MTLPHPNGVLEKYLLRIIEERDKQYELRFKAVDDARRDALMALEKATAAALVAQKEAIAAALTAQKEAIIKAEAAQNSYNAGHNDLARKMDSQYNTMMPRIEAQNQAKAFDEKLNALKSDLEKAIDAHTDGIDSLRNSRSEGEGKGAGAHALMSYIAIAISVIVGILAIVFRFVP